MFQINTKNYWKYYPGQKIETTARTWRRRVICRACTRLCLTCVPVSIFFGQVSRKEIVREVARSDKPYLRNLQIAKHKSLRSERLPDLCFAICRFSQVRPHKVSSLLLVPCPHRIWGKLKKKKKRVGVHGDRPDRHRNNGRGSQDC